MKAVISDGFLSEKYSFYSVSPDEVQNTNSGEECEHHGEPDKRVAVLNHTQAPDIPTAPTTHLQNQEHYLEKGLFKTTNAESTIQVKEHVAKHIWYL